MWVTFTVSVYRTSCSLCRLVLVFTETASGDQATASNCGHSSSSSSSQSLSSAPGALGSTPSSMSSSSSGQVAQSVQSPSPALLQDPALLHQLLPALQATLQMNNGSMDMAKLNEGKEQIRLKFIKFVVLCVIQYNKYIKSTLLVHDCTPHCDQVITRYRRIYGLCIVSHREWAVTELKNTKRSTNWQKKSLLSDV